MQSPGRASQNFGSRDEWTDAMEGRGRKAKIRAVDDDCAHCRQTRYQNQKGHSQLASGSTLKGLICLSDAQKDWLVRRPLR
jgi:hypothetical protein